MRPLRDDDTPDDPVAREAARLLRHAGRSEPGAFVEERVRARIAAGTRRRRRPRARGYAFAALALLLATFASAWVARVVLRHRDAQRDGALPQQPVAQAFTASPPDAPLGPVSAVPSAPEHVPAHSRPRAPRPASVEELPRVAPVEPEPTEVPPVVVAEPSPAERAALVLRARVALRHDHEPSVALRLVDRYVSENPSGPVVEEALELAIEARAALGDHAAAAKAAQVYLDRFPEGRFADFATRAKSTSLP